MRPKIYRSLRFNVTTKALDKESVDGTESIDYDCSESDYIIFKIEASAANVTADFRVFLTDFSGNVVVATAMVTDSDNSGIQTGVSESGYYHCSTITTNSYGAYRARLMLASTPTNAGSISAWFASV